MNGVLSFLAPTLVVAGLGACSALSPQADQTRYFVLTSRASAPDPGGRFASTLGLGPVKVPDHLDEGIVTLLADEEIRVSDTDRWAEPLRDSLTGVLRQDLASLLGVDRVLVYPWQPSASPDLAVALEVTHFERTTHGTVHVAARWSIQRGAEPTPVVVDGCSLDGAFSGNDTRAAVAALSVAVTELSRRIAADLRAIPEKP